jgi:putative oxidoreductase
LSAAFGPRAHIIPLILRIGLGLLFVVTGLLKLGHASDLAATITAFGFGLPPPLIATVAVALPPCEILLGAYLVGGWLLPITSIAASVLLTAFIVVLAMLVARGNHVPCGCFGPSDAEPTTWLTVLRDGIFIMPAVYLAWWSRARERLE